MKQFIHTALMVSGLLLVSATAFASPAVDNMSDIEVSDYAIRMSDVLENIYREQLCLATDENCVRNEFARNGVAFEDKEAVQKRLIIMLGSIN